MKQKTIEKVLEKKLNQWVDTITDYDVRSLVKANTIVTGGSIASMLLDEKVNDIDIYFRNIETVRAVAKYYNKLSGDRLELMDGRVRPNDFPTDEDLQRQEEIYGNVNIAQRVVAWKSMNGEVRIKLYHPAGYYSVTGDPALMDEEPQSQEENSIFTSIQEAREQVKEGSYSPLFFTSNAITLSDGIQLVLRFFGEAEELHKNYDFVHATSYYDYKAKKVTVPYAAYESLMNKELKYIGSLYPVTSVIRTKKFIKRGWTCGAGTYFKILFQVSELNLRDIDVLTEQLSGVDIAYFGLMIDALKNRDASKSDDITYQYISELIDRIFG